MALSKPNAFSVDGEHLVDGASRRRRYHDIYVIPVSKFTSNTNPKWAVIVAFLNFPYIGWTENIWCFQSAPSIFKFRWRSVVRAFFWVQHSVVQNQVQGHGMKGSDKNLYEFDHVIKIVFFKLASELCSNRFFSEGSLKSKKKIKIDCCSGSTQPASN